MTELARDRAKGDPFALKGQSLWRVPLTDDGVVVIDHTYCIGCQYCVQACPYGCRFIHPKTETAEKCHQHLGDVAEHRHFVTCLRYFVLQQAAEAFLRARVGTASGELFVTGRIKELIIKGGENIAPAEIDRRVAWAGEMLGLAALLDRANASRRLIRPR